MGSYDVMQVCLNGHQVTDSYVNFPAHRQDFCSECGAKTIFKCIKCDTPIRGRYYMPGVVALLGPTPVPEHCHKCGVKYPWLKKTDKIEVTEKNQAVKMIEHICSRFHIVARQMLIRHKDRATLAISDEYDVQDLLHGLLKIHFDDVRPEEWTPSYAGGSSRIDFLLAKDQIAVEVKKTRKELTVKDIGDQLIIDIDRYQKHPKCSHLICFIYDPEGRIENPQGLEKDLSGKRGQIDVVALVVPKGL